MKKVFTENAPKAIWPYSQAIISGGFMFCSGQIWLNPISMEIVSGGIKQETLQIFANIQALLQSVWTDKSNVIKTTVFLQNMNDFSEFNELYEKFFTDHKPARTTVEVSKLPKNALVEIEIIAEVS